MSWFLNADSGTTSQLSLNTITGSDTTFFPDPLIDWLPYEWKKYIPAWHILKSYGCQKISLGIPENETLEEYDKAMEEITQQSLEDWED